MKAIAQSISYQWPMLGSQGKQTILEHGFNRLPIKRIGY